MMVEIWEDTKKRLLFYEREPDRPPSRGASPSYQMLVNAVFARALRLIMEKMEGS